MENELSEKLSLRDFGKLTRKISNWRLLDSEWYQGRFSYYRVEVARRGNELGGYYYFGLLKRLSEDSDSSVCSLTSKSKLARQIYRYVKTTHVRERQ